MGQRTLEARHRRARVPLTLAVELAKMKNQFALRKPCANCPFRRDAAAIELQPGRKEEIIEGLLSGEKQTFHCHKTVYRDDGRNHDDEGNYRPVDVCQCPGAAAVARKFGRDTVMVQVATRLGVIDLDHYDAAIPSTIGPNDLTINRDSARV